MQECHHCFTVISPLQNNYCPACGRDLSEPGKYGSDRSFVTISSNHKIPINCVACGRTTDNKARITASPEKTVKKKPYEIVLIVIFFPVFIFMFAAEYIYKLIRNKNEVKMSLDLPICTECSEIGKFEPQKVDLKEYEMSFIVHKHFKNAFEELNHL